MFFIKSHFLIAQNKERQVSVNLTYTKMDLFIGCSFIDKRNAMDHEYSIHTGITKFFFQSSLFPMIQYNYTYNFLKKQNMRLGPCLIVNMAILNLKTTKSNFHYYPETLIGYKFSYGNKIGVIHKSAIGVLFEGFKDYLSNPKWVNTFSYNFNIGIYYAID